MSAGSRGVCPPRQQQPPQSQSQPQSKGKRPVGESGSEALWECLITAADPVSALTAFSSANGVDSTYASDLTPVLSLLESHHVSRVTVHQALLGSIKSSLLTAIPSMPSNKLLILLQDSFPYIHFEELRPIPLAVLETLREIPENYLRFIASNKELYQLCSVSVWRQIWPLDSGPLKDEICSIIRPVLENSGICTENHEWFEKGLFTSKKHTTSADGPIVSALRRLVGRNSVIYNLVVEILTQHFITTSNPLLCTLRSNLLMSLHGDGVSEIYDKDPIHNFAWCVDACIKSPSLDERRIQEVFSHACRISEGNSRKIGDLAVIMANPFALNAFLSSIVPLLKSVVERELVPKDDPAVIQVTRLLQLGMSVHEILMATGPLKLPEEDYRTIQKFYPIIAEKIVLEGFEDNEPLHPGFKKYMQQSSLCRKCGLYYIVARVQKRDFKSALPMLLAATELDDLLQSEYEFCQSLISVLCTQKDFHEAIFNTMAILKNLDTVHTQLVRYLIHMSTHLPTPELCRHVTSLTTECALDPRTVQVPYNTLIAKSSGKLTPTTTPSLFSFLSL